LGQIAREREEDFGGIVDRKRRDYSAEEAMREAEFRAMQSVNAKRSGLLLDQFMFLETRQRALEAVLCGLTLWCRFKLLVWPDDFKEIVDRTHLVFLKEEWARRDAAVEKVKQESRKPKLTIVGANGIHA
jgi:hypothetical protein